MRLSAALRRFARAEPARTSLRNGALVILACGQVLVANAAVPQRVTDLKITILSTMLADGQELGEWGFSALVAVDGHRLLFDTGAHSDVVLKNALSLKIDLSNVPDVILSHSHSDHVGGLLTLRNAFREAHPHALATAHVGEGIFASRWTDRREVEENPMIAIRAEFEKSGGVFSVHEKPVELFPGVWLTGPTPRPHPEHNWGGQDKIVTSSGSVEDTLPEDSALIFSTGKGLVVLTGCGHAGVINIIEYAKKIVGEKRIHALIGGIHLFNASDETLKWTEERLAESSLEYFLGAHCTGIEPVFRFRQDLKLDRKHAVVAAVGSTFDLARGIDPRHIAQ